MSQNGLVPAVIGGALLAPIIGIAFTFGLMHLTGTDIATMIDGQNEAQQQILSFRQERACTEQVLAEEKRANADLDEQFEYCLTLADPAMKDSCRKKNDQEFEALFAAGRARVADCHRQAGLP